MHILSVKTDVSFFQIEKKKRDCEDTWFLAVAEQMNGYFLPLLRIVQGKCFDF